MIEIRVLLPKHTLTELFVLIASALGPTGTVRKAARPPLDSELGDSEVFEQEGNINNGWVSVKNPNSVNFTSDDEMSIVASDAGVAFSPPSDSFLVCIPSFSAVYACEVLIFHLTILV
jgi:hypothetical protein